MGDQCHVWQLNPTEGPQRERRRLERATRRIKSKFFRSTSIPAKINNLGNESISEVTRVQVEDNPLAQFLREDPAENSKAVVEWLHTHEKIYVTEKCRRITPEHEAKGGELLMSKDKLYYVGNEPLSKCFVSRGTISDNGFCRQWQLDKISELLPRWFGLRDCAIEIFLSNGQTEMFAFENSKKRDDIISIISGNVALNGTTSRSLGEIQQKWRKGEITNFSYLMELNKASGRTFNDLMQYPVFPFILSNYKTAKLNLKNSDNFRDLARPISIQSDEKKRFFEERYYFLDEERQRNPHADDPYHYGSHYSNSGTVLHFLLRLPPFTQMFLDYQELVKSRST